MARPTKVTYTVRDNDDEETKASFYLISTINTIAGIETAAQGIVEAIQDMITGDVVDASISYPLDISGWVLNASAGQAQDRRVGARAVFETVDGFKAELNMPTFDIETFVPTPGKDVNQAAAESVALISAVVATGVATSQDRDLSGIVKWYETWGGKA